MNFTRLLSLALTGAGAAASGQFLRRRAAWEPRHNRVALAVDLDDTAAIAVRAARPLDDVLHELAHHGATHASLPELTLNRLRATGALIPRAPARPIRAAAPVGHWNYLYGDAALAAALAAELAARLPQTEARTVGANTLAFAGDLSTVGEIGLGFDAALAQRIQQAGLHCLPRPVSYAWPEDRLIDLTLAQAAVFGRLVAFDGDLILGHEMHLDATLAALTREGLTLAYFAESRHQKGDWFVAKRRAPHVVLAHRLTPAEMVPLDLHAAAHLWAHLARERGLRLCYVNAFRVLHATAPLEFLHYVAHIKEALEHAGFVVCAEPAMPPPVPAPSRATLALAGLTSAGVAAGGLSAALDLPDVIGVPLTVAAAAGAAALPYLEAPRNALEEQYPPSYAPKLLALAAAAAAPAAALHAARRDGPAGWLAGSAGLAAAAAELAAVTSGADYHLRIETYKGFNLDWAVPLAAAALTLENRALRLAALAGLAAAWHLANTRGLDPLARFDPAPAEGHTHHLSAAARWLGDLQIAAGAQPARKWAGLAPLGAAASLVLAERGQRGWAAAAAGLSAAGGAFGLVGFRRSERALSITGRAAGLSFGAGLGLGALLLLAARRE